MGAGSTFTGQGATNGYHPLWQAMVAGLAWLSGGERSSLLHAVLLTQWMCVAVGLFTLIRVGRRAGLASPELLVMALILGLFSDRGWGSEGMLNLAMHGVALWAWQRALGRPRPATLFGTGLVVGLLVLSRLDVVFLAVALWGLSAWLLSDKRLLVWLGLGIALPVLAYLWADWLVFGQALPISGTIKSTFPHLALSDPLGKLGVLGVLVWALGLVALVLASRADTRTRPLLAVLGLGTLLHGAYTALFTAPNWSTDVVYYYVTGVINAGFCFSELARRALCKLPSLSPKAKHVLVGVLAVIPALGGTGRAVRGAVGASGGTEALAHWLKASLPPDARIATVDAPGRLAWASGLPVFALDGLTEPLDFDEALQRPDLQAWARRTRITHIVSQRTRYDAPWALVEPRAGGLRITVRAPASGVEVGVLDLPDPPLVDLCDLVSTSPCLDHIGVWVWPSS
ncbi:MAG: hypothetical protein GXP62_10690 [Oligoflexia bacterium]|nr:hypothetical protein [Oligoflexia bacterium]